MYKLAHLFHAGDGEGVQTPQNSSGKERTAHLQEKRHTLGVHCALTRSSPELRTTYDWSLSGVASTFSPATDGRVHRNHEITNCQEIKQKTHIFRILHHDKGVILS